MSSRYLSTVKSGTFVNLTESSAYFPTSSRATILPSTPLYQETDTRLQANQPSGQEGQPLLSPADDGDFKSMLEASMCMSDLDLQDILESTSPTMSTPPQNNIRQEQDIFPSTTATTATTPQRNSSPNSPRHESALLRPEGVEDFESMLEESMRMANLNMQDIFGSTSPTMSTTPQKYIRQRRPSSPASLSPTLRLQEDGDFKTILEASMNMYDLNLDDISESSPRAVLPPPLTPHRTGPHRKVTLSGVKAPRKHSISSDSSSDNESARPRELGNDEYTAEEEEVTPTNLDGPRLIPFDHIGTFTLLHWLYMSYKPTLCRPTLF